MSRMYRGKEIFKPLNTGWIDKNVACVREWVANIFFYCKDNAVIMIDAGYNYDRLVEKMGWLGIDPQSVQHILITHQDTDHVGAVLSLIHIYFYSCFIVHAVKYHQPQTSFKLRSLIHLSRNCICSSVWNQCSPPGMTVRSAWCSLANADTVSMDVRLSCSP